MSLSIECPSCGRVFKMPTSIQGKKVCCSNCQHVFRTASTDPQPPGNSNREHHTPTGNSTSTSRKTDYTDLSSTIKATLRPPRDRRQRKLLLGVGFLFGGSVILVLAALFFINRARSGEGGLAGVESSEPVVFASPEAEAFFTTGGWGTLAPTERFGYLRPRSEDSIYWELNQSAERFESAMQDQLGKDWFEELPNACQSRVGGYLESEHFLNDDYLPIVHPEKAPIVGIRYSIHRPFGSPLPSRLLPVYHRDEEKVPIMARPGYALAGMNVVSGELCVLRIQFIFMRIVDGHFDRHDQYTTDWIGLKKPKGVPVRLAGDGRAVYGLSISESHYLIGIRLICEAR